MGPVRFELTSLRLKGECRWPLCDEPKTGAPGGSRIHILSGKGRVLCQLSFGRMVALLFCDIIFLMYTLEQRQKKGYVGGKKRGSVLRQQAIEKYSLSPKLCLYCNQPIPIPSGKRPSYIRRWRFCSKSHAAKFNNEHSPSLIASRKTPTNTCCDCSTPISSARKRCKPCSRRQLQSMYLKTKKECTHSTIRDHARNITSTWPQICAICGFDKFVETCHRKPVRDFPDNAMIAEINAETNLVILCPNDHWLYDHKMVTLLGDDPSPSGL